MVFERPGTWVILADTSRAVIVGTTLAGHHGHFRVRGTKVTQQHLVSLAKYLTVQRKCPTKIGGVHC